MSISNNLNVKKELDKFYKRVVKESKTALTKKNKNASKALYNSIGYELEVHKNSFSSALIMEEYGEYIDKGVKGVGGTKADGTTWKLKTVKNNLYKYTNKRPPAKAFDSWMIRRGIAPRSKGGKFTSRKGIRFAIAESVYRTGIETTEFYSKPLESAFKSLPDNIVKAFALDIDKLL